MNTSKNDIEYYMSLDYPIEIKKEEGTYFATIPQLGSYAFVGDGETLEEAVQDLNESKRILFEQFLKQGVSIPEPIAEEENEYSGKFVVRVPKYLHGNLVQYAKNHGVSLNTLVTTLLAENFSKKENEEKILEKMHRLLFEVNTRPVHHHYHFKNANEIRYEDSGYSSIAS